MSDLYSMPGHLIRRLHQISTAIFQERTRTAGFDLTPVQFAALDTLSRHPGIDQATLAHLIAYDRATIGGVVDRLETKGLLQRTVSKKDRRARIVTLSDAGAALLARVTPVVQDLQGEILAGLDADEQNQFLELAQKSAAAGRT